MFAHFQSDNLDAAETLLAEGFNGSFRDMVMNKKQ